MGTGVSVFCFVPAEVLLDSFLLLLSNGMVSQWFRPHFTRISHRLLHSTNPRDSTP